MGMLFVDRTEALKVAHYAISKASNDSSEVDAEDLAVIVNECDANAPVSALTDTDARDVVMPKPENPCANGDVNGASAAGAKGRRLPRARSI